MSWLNEGVLISPSNGNRYDYLQAAEAKTMEDAIAAYIAALIAENTAGSTTYGIADIDIAGGGDGHTFVVRILRTNNASLTGNAWASTNLVNVQVKVWMGSDAEALAEYQEAALASLTTGATSVGILAAGHAGAAKGTRFMGFIGGIRTPQN